MLILVAGADPARWQIVQKALANRFAMSFAVDMRSTLDLLVRQQPPVLLICSPLLDADEESCIKRVAKQQPAIQIIVVRDDGQARKPPRAISVPHTCIDPTSIQQMLRPTIDSLLNIGQAAIQHHADATPSKTGCRCVDKDPFDFPASRPMVQGVSKSMRRVAEIIRRVAPVDATVLLYGESGTGKELYARRIHCMSERASGPFRAISLPSVPAELFESTMFGHERGAFTGAVAQSPGAFEKAGQGTLFLDEVSSLKPECQPKLLRAIQEREIERVGARDPISCDVRIIAATNVDLKKMVADEQFRDDLYHRLSVITIELPPLRRRPEDIPPLVQFFLRRYSRKFRCQTPEVCSEAMKALQCYRWPGNVRELENSVQRALLLSPGSTLNTDAFFEQSDESTATDALPLSLQGCSHSMAEVEQAYIEQVMEHTGGNQSRAAQILQIDRKTLRAKLQKYSEAADEKPAVRLCSA